MKHECKSKLKNKDVLVEYPCAYDGWHIIFDDKRQNVPSLWVALEIIYCPWCGEKLEVKDG